MSRIAFVSSLVDVPWGGSEALWHQTALRLKERGHDVHANVHWWPQTPKAVETLQRAGIAVQIRRMDALSKVKQKLVPALAKKSTNWLAAVQPELVVISLACHGAGLEWMQACAAHKIPYVVVAHAVVEHWWPGDALQKPIACAYNEATAMYFVSHGNHRQVSTQLGDALPAARVAYNPFNVAYDANPAWPDEGNTLRLAGVGRLEPGTKGQDILLAVLGQEKWKSRPVNVTFFGSGPYEKSLCELRDYFGLQGRVKVGGFTEDVESIWKTHHALALTSRAEGLPIVIVEAMLCGRACLVTDVAGNAELMQDNISGFVAAAPKAEFVDEALERLWQCWQAGKLQEIGQNAAKAIRQQIPPDPIAVFADEIERLLQPKS